MLCYNLEGWGGEGGGRGVQEGGGRGVQEGGVTCMPVANPC